MCHQLDSLAEWSKAPDLGSGPKGRGFKSHNCQFFTFDDNLTVFISLINVGKLDKTLLTLVKVTSIRVINKRKCVEVMQYEIQPSNGPECECTTCHEHSMFKRAGCVTL